MSSLAELRKELKEFRKSTVHPVSRMKKADLLAELAKHKAVAPVAVADKEEVKVEAPKKAPVKKVAKEVVEKVAAIKVPKEKESAAPKEKAAAPKKKAAK